MDMQHPTCFTLSGFLRRAGREFGLTSLPNDLMEFAEGVEALCRQGQRLALCIDEFEAFTMRREAFTRDFFLTLRACSQEGMSIFTTSRQPLSKLVDYSDPTSPLYSIFALVYLGPFTPQTSADFLISFVPNYHLSHQMRK